MDSAFEDVSLDHRISLPEPPAFDQPLFADPAHLTAGKAHLDAGNEELRKAFERRVPVRHLINARAILVDHLLKQLWSKTNLEQSACLIAVGGYGRGELHPGSDIDLLILVRREKDPVVSEILQQLVAFLWDLRLEIGHSVRTVKQCLKAANSDITIATNLMEARYLAGDTTLFDSVKENTAASKMWPAKPFFTAKVAEQRARYRKYRGSSFDLEPNLKGSPGGLRDVQLIGWIAKRHFESASLHELANKGIFSLREYHSLVRSQLFLWKVRFALHLLTGRGEDRLLFQHQKALADYLGYKDSSHSLAVELLMKRYFRAVITIRNLTELLIQVFEQEILSGSDSRKVVPIDSDFELVNDRIALKQPATVADRPELLLKTFLVAANYPGNKHVNAQTLRAIRDNRHLIDDDFRSDPKHKALFLEFFSLKHRFDRALFLMKRNGILAQFLPAFDAISGQMQFDMFHAFTVDEHTLFLLKNLTRFANPEFQEEFSYCSEIMLRLKKPQLIFLAGLFHDIAKGRGGDHSELGAQDAFQFCRSLGMPENDAETVAWLVQQHLVMSTTAQRKDISDPDVIDAFAKQMGSLERLELLYILTVADIRATSPKLWNSWKDSLLRDLYLTTKRYLLAQSDQRISVSDHISAIKQAALAELKELKISVSSSESLWEQLDSDYFFATPVKRIVWHTSNILKHAHRQTPLVEVKTHHNQGGTEIFIYTQDRPGLFATIAASLAKKNVIVQNAQLTTNKSGFCLDTFVVLEQSGEPIQSSTRIQSIKKLLQKNLKSSSLAEKSVNFHMTRRLDSFDVPTTIEFMTDTSSNFTLMELTALDRPGLLAAIGIAVHKCKMNIHSARIVTLGEKIEDVFEVSSQQRQPLSSEQRQQLKQTLFTTLNELNEQQQGIH